ncbi:hypothetical protein CLAFUW4_07358 [Fulvia fulva]|uniref:Uncharacterized protein n=1 Tax=Passalora fulva TaxID=5499 RepID=A0A9Q8UQW3_PASFU|nr:uncharacterized protein CLAFUR5_07488 [Fulvia fulva]KAK4621804.1 hypothetical protein CLAFUR4_07365 [Fulvia fulva]KAK4623037.1 hypothetical protein CLAFUR0_07363 [Fulvia fulva]UJO19133.1 hypothetical protein CLAFUR5_07488 [Fulvia fulva]WPV16390.1 hypothetical protein CLAFUW4_07358 [Fulvia fulva]WPV30631.1 hypothetical protein CLAFUW7_07360 [Fulvia fulva]
MPAYHKCSVSELRNFCETRKLVMPLSEKASRTDLIHTLHAADESQPLDESMDLPPEVRVIIYKFYLGSLNTQRQMPAQPPLLKVSRLVRQESFPLFYDLCDFAILFGEWGYNYSMPQDHSFFKAASVPTFAQGLQGPSQPLGHLVKRLCVAADVHHARRLRMRYDVCIEAGASGVQMTIQRDDKKFPFTQSPEVETELRRRAGVLLDMFRERQRGSIAVGMVSLEAEDTRELGSDSRARAEVYGTIVTVDGGMKEDEDVAKQGTLMLEPADYARLGSLLFMLPWR